MTSPKPIEDSPYPFARVLEDELDAILRARVEDRVGGDAGIPPDGPKARAHATGLVGLALSGGGIRSATFNLGVLQALAQHRLLSRFDYLSTVSGGGYIGGWLSAWIQRAGGVRAVEEKLAPPAPGRESEEEPLQVSFLRQYSNFLTPRVGAFTADLWAGIATYLRNVLLNAVIVIAFTAALLMLPWFAFLGALQLRGIEDHLWSILPLGLFGVAVLFVSLNLARQYGEDEPKPPWYASQRAIIGTIVIPIVLSAALGAVWFWARKVGDVKTPWWHYMAVPSIVYLGLWVIALQRTRVRLERFRRARGGDRAERPVLSMPFGALTAHFASWLASVALGFALLASVTRIFELWGPTDDALWPVLVWGMPLMLLLFGVAVVLQIGIMGRFFPEQNREWWSRLGGWLIIASLAWVGLFATSVYGPLAVSLLGDWAKGLGFGWIATTIAGVIAGRSGRTGGEKGGRYLEWLSAIAPYVFIVGLLLAMSYALYALMPAVLGGFGFPIRLPAEEEACGLSAFVDPERCAMYYCHLSHVAAGAIVLPFLALLAIGLLLSWRVDVNLFSLHMMYRNRIIRCYLGASNPARNPHPFTGFDPKDSPRLDALKRTAANGDTVFQRPYHLLNAAINLTSGTNLAWQQRKAGNFMFSPQWCGYDLADSAGCFQPTPDFVKDLGWLSLGTPMGISGAAASPNMGFHSSPPVAVLMTVFNVRLGWWLQNPRFGSVWRSPGPAWGLLYLGQELLGMSNERAGYVSVSDGGHFENLGLYELVRRRCRVIFSVDAGQDRSFGFDDLANAIRRCYTDFGIRIDIDTRSVCPDDKGCSAFQCAVGSIHYEDVDPGAAPGTLFYMKPCITGDEPADVLNYRATHPEFPHESTGDQWFDEAQFESYRKLGHHMTSKLLYDVVKDDMTTADFSRLLWETWGPAGRNR